jgi:hypothetical protein
MGLRKGHGTAECDILCKAFAILTRRSDLALP